MCTCISTEDVYRYNQCNSSGAIKCFEVEERARQGSREGGLVPGLWHNQKLCNETSQIPEPLQEKKKNGKVYICKTIA